MFTKTNRFRLVASVALASAPLTSASSGLQSVENVNQTTITAPSTEQGFVIVRCQGHFRHNGRNVYITGGIPIKHWNQSQGAYGRMIQDGVDENFHGAGTATYFRSPGGSAVHREIAVTDRTYSTWRWSPAQDDDDSVLLAVWSEASDEAFSLGDQEGERRYGGSASCEITCSDGSCKYITCNVSYEYSSEAAAKRALKARLKAEAAAQDGKITGSISFDVKVKF